VKLYAQNATAERRQTIVAAPLISQIWGGAMLRLDDQPLVGESLDHPIQIARVEPDEATRTLGDLLHEGVAVAVVLGQCEQELEIDGLQGKKVAGVGRHGVLEELV
jgi:hypothetical protein